MTIIKSTRVYAAAGSGPAAIVVEDGVIRSIKPYDYQCQGAELVDFGDKRIIPGIIDLHNHGFKGHSAGGDKAEVQRYTRALPSVGVTGILPTTTDYQGAVEAIKEPRAGARILGIHSEGPFFNPEMMGAGTRGDGSLPEIPEPTVAAMEEMVARCQGNLRYITIAPETVKDKAVFKYLQDHRVVISAGHTTATYDQYMEGIGDGVQASCHTGNAMRGISHREIGALGAALMYEDIYCELIADFIHIHPRMIELMFRVKDPQKFILVSDSSDLSGNPPGVYEMKGHGLGKLTLHEDGRVLTEIGRLAGSSLYVLRGIKNLVEGLGMPLETVLLMTGRNPAQLLGIAHQKGSIALGRDADLVVLEDDFTVYKTMVEGDWVYQK